MEIDLAAVSRLDVTISFRKQFCDTSLRNRLVGFHVRTYLAGVVLEAPARRMESFANRDIQILPLWTCLHLFPAPLVANVLFSSIQSGLALYNDFALRDSQVYAYMKRIPLLAVARRRFDQHSTTCDRTTKFLQFLSLGPDLF